MGHNHAQNGDRPPPAEEQPNPVYFFSSNIFECWRLNPSSFDGRHDLMIVEDWIIQIEKIFIILELTKE